MSGVTRSPCPAPGVIASPTPAALAALRAGAPHPDGDAQVGPRLTTCSPSKGPFPRLPLAPSPKQALEACLERQLAAEDPLWRAAHLGAAERAPALLQVRLGCWRHAAH